ncbi:MAG: EscU/YscU/HrcU family type III secretion system export apparatus switch protein [Proteobacteria bacterium]|nr:EscU/YscU/HrcU family type III secretion system export apparatus switch protein [Pseudomonadota bacterium]
MADNNVINKAVAIVYDEKESAAPRIVASGKGVVAEKIIATAREAGVHIKEDPDLVEILAKIPLGNEIPVELYQTIAEVLAFVYQVNNKFKQKIGER